MVLDVKQIKKRYKKGKLKEQWRSIYEEAYEMRFLCVTCTTGIEGNVPGQNKMKRVFDSTAIHNGPVC